MIGKIRILPTRSEKLEILYAKQSRKNLQKKTLLLPKFFKLFFGNIRKHKDRA